MSAEADIITNESSHDFHMKKEQHIRNWNYAYMLLVVIVLYHRNKKIFKGLFYQKI